MPSIERTYHSAKLNAVHLENLAVLLDIQTLSGPEFPNGPSYLSKRQVKEILKNIDSAEFNIKLVKEQLHRYLDSQK